MTYLYISLQNEYTEDSFLCHYTYVNEKGLGGDIYASTLLQHNSRQK